MQVSKKISSSISENFPKTIILGEPDNVIMVKSILFSGNVNKIIRVKYLNGDFVYGNQQGVTDSSISLFQPQILSNSKLNVGKDVQIISHDGSLLTGDEYINIEIEYELISIV